MSHHSRQGAMLGRRALLTAALAALLALTLCGAALASTSPSPAATTTLHIGWLQEPDNLNPFIGIQGTDYMLWHMNYDFLVGFDAKTLEPRPELATKWSVSPDGKTWTFTIRSGEKWQDGQPVTARDVAFTFNYINKNQLLNLSAYTDGIVSAKAVSDTTVLITTSAPKANMLKMVVPILPEHIWSKVSGKAATTTYQNSPPIIGDGPFQIVEWQKGKFVRLVANKHYWGGAPKVDQVVFQLYTNPDTMASDLKLGTLDGAIDVPMAQFKQLGTTPGITTNEGTSWRFTELAMNCSTSKYSKGNPVLRDVRVRQAVNWAIDRAKVVSIAEQNYATVGSSLIVPYSKYHWEPPADQAYAYDPSKANAMLDAAGYKDVNGDGYRETLQGKKLDLRFYATTDAPDNQTAGKLIVSWLKNIGIKVTYTVIDPGALTDAQYNFVGNNYAPDWDMFIWYWTQDVDPQFMLSIYTPAQSTGYGWNDCLWTSPAYTKLNAQQSQTIDDATRIPIAQQMQQLFYQGAGNAILTYPYQLEAYNSDKWQGWVHVPGDSTSAQKGAVLYSYNNIDTYRFVSAKTAAAATSSSSSTLLIVVIVAAVVVVLAAVLLLRRSRGRSETV